jgi:hypothetical protein
MTRCSACGLFIASNILCHECGNDGELNDLAPEPFQTPSDETAQLEAIERKHVGLKAAETHFQKNRLPPGESEMTMTEIACPFCGKAFGNRQDVVTHSVNIHPGKPVIAELDALVPLEARKEAVARQNEDQPEIQDPLEYVIHVDLREAKQEDRLVRQINYTMLSAYTANPINLAVNAPSGEGKSHTIIKVSEKFPEADVIVYAGMSEKALFHRNGVLVMKSENGEYEPVEVQLEEIQYEIERKTDEISISSNCDVKQGLRNQIKKLNDEQREIRKNAKKLIDLQHRIIIFMDTPNPRLFEALMPLLSHDKFEVEYEFVDTHAGIKTRSNVLRGWPAVIFAQAIDYSHYQRFPEIQRRFIVTNPKMSVEKYREAVTLTSVKLGLPDFAYQARIVSDDAKLKAKMIIESIKARLLDLTTNNSVGKNSVFIPFNESLAKAIPVLKAFDMTTAHRFFTYLSLLPMIRADRRPRIEYRKEGNPIMQVIPMATFDDLKEAMQLMEYSNGVRPYILEWYYSVFLKAYLAKSDLDKQSEYDNIGNFLREKEEKRKALTTVQLVEKTYEIQKKKLSTKQILENYINPLINQAYIDKSDSELDKRANIYYPIVETENKNLFDSDQSNSILQHGKVQIADSATYPSPEYVISQILAVLKYSSGSKILRLLDHEDKEQKPEVIVARYYQRPEEYFVKGWSPTII